MAATSAHYRNKDFQETTLEKDGVPVLCFASTYGFRNIQNLVQKLKRGKSPYHFVEVMACPSGKVQHVDVKKFKMCFFVRAIALLLHWYCMLATPEIEKCNAIDAQKSCVNLHLYLHHFINIQAV